MRTQYQTRRSYPTQIESPQIVLDAFPGKFVPILEGRYEVRLAETANEVASVLRLRHNVFSVELGAEQPSLNGTGLEFDAYDFRCRHLIVIDRETGATVGTYRLNTWETAGSVRGFYSANEFTIEDLPADILANGIEIGRACIAKEHRNTKALFLLWKALLAYSTFTGKRYFFGCCSLFTRDPDTGLRAYLQLCRDGQLDSSIRVSPKHDRVEVRGEPENAEDIELPALFKMYLRLGATVCSPPMIDTDFGTIDFFVVLDVNAISDKYRRMFA